MSGSVRAKPITVVNKNAARPTGSSLQQCSKKTSSSRQQRSLAPVPKSFDVSQDEVIQKIKLRSGVYRQLTSQDLMKFDTTDDPYIESEAPRQQTPEEVHEMKDETVKFNQALKLYEQGEEWLVK